MNARLLKLAIERETDIILVRERTRRVAALVGFDAQDQTRITTAVSEIARNTLDYAGGGSIDYQLVGRPPHQLLEIVAQDSGPGMADPAAVLAGTLRSANGLGVGITGARRLMDRFELDSLPGKGTVIRMGKLLPARARPVQESDLKQIAQALAEPNGLDPLNEIRRQNQEAMQQLQELERRQEELVQLNQELQDTNRGVVALYAELDDRADHLRRADELKSRFLSNMSHEFRTPLNSILGLSRLLLTRNDGALSDEQEKQVQFIKKAAETLTELVNDLLDLAKVEAGKIVVSPSDCTIADIFSTLRGMLRPLLAGDLLLMFDDAGDLPTLVTDEGKVSQILRNFISNAIKFTERGEVRVRATLEDDDTITITVADTGIGIAAENIETIWQEFSQIVSPLQSRVKGTGLGLPLSKKLAELLGGTVGVESTLDRGSTFWLRLPRVYRLAVAEVASQMQWTLDPAKIPVLSVEDNAADAFVFERVFTGSRYHLLQAHSLAEARRAIEHFTPAAILLDIMLVGEESWRFLIEVKQRERTRDIPVIVISSTRDDVKARSLGADEYLEKPIDPRRLLHIVDQVTHTSSVTRVLIVDDQEVSRYLARQLLPRGAFELIEAAGVAEGLERLRRDRPDVVLLDLDMPDIDGFAGLERMAAERDHPPVVVVTSMALDALQRRRLAAAAQILSKQELTAGMLVNAIRAVSGHDTGTR